MVVLNRSVFNKDVGGCQLVTEEDIKMGERGVP